MYLPTYIYVLIYLKIKYFLLGEMNFGVPNHARHIVDYNIMLDK